MAQYYQFTFIDAPIETVWSVVFHEAEQHGSIISMQEPKLLVVQSRDICSVYGLRQYPAMDNKTGVYLVVTHDETAAADLVNAPDLFKALEAMPVDVAPDVYERAKTHLLEIKALANEAAKQPAKSAYASKSTFGAQKSSIDPKKSRLEGAAGSPIGEGMPVVSLRLMWVVFIFFAISMYLNAVFPAAALLAANWLSMGRPRKAVATLVTSIAVWGLFAVPIQIVFAGLTLSPRWPFSMALALQVIPAIGVIFWQAKQQIPAYHQAVERYGKPSGWTCRNIVIAVAVILVGSTLANTWFRIFNPRPLSENFTIASARTYTDDRITFNYPNDWAAVDVADATCDQVEAQHEGRLTCWGMGAEERLSLMMYIEFKDSFGFFSSLDSASQTDIASIESNRETEREADNATQVTLKIDGRDAIKYQYPYTIKNSSTTLAMIGTVLYIRDGYDWIRLYIYTPPGRVETADAIVNSVHFVTPLDD